MKIGFRPLGSKIIVLPSAAEEKTAGGLIIPDASREKLPKGEIIAIGDEEMNVSVGDVVLYHPNAGQELSLSAGRFLMMNAIEVYGIFEED